MPRAGEPRVTVRFSAAEHAALAAAASSAGVAVGALVREAAVRHGAGVAREAAEGRISLRRAAAVREVSPASRPLRVEPGAVDADPALARAIAFRRATGSL